MLQLSWNRWQEQRLRLKADQLILVPGSPAVVNLHVSGMASVPHQNSGSHMLDKKISYAQKSFSSHTKLVSPITSFTIQTLQDAEASTGPTKHLARAALHSGRKAILQAEEEHWTQLKRTQPGYYLQNEMRIIYGTVQEIFTSSD